MSSQDQPPLDAPLGPTINLVLAPFEGRPWNDALVAEMAETLNRELASILEGRVIHLSREGSTVRIGVAETPARSGGEPRTLASTIGVDAVAAALAA